MKKKLFILDAINFLFRSYYAIAPMTDGEGNATHALFGFIRSLLKIISDFKPDFIVAVFDGENNKKQRLELFDGYKSNRKQMPEDLVYQLKQAHQFCSIYGIPLLTIEGVEADDVIGSICKFAKTQELESYVCSSDKDLCQLVDQSTFVVHVHKDNQVLNEEGVQALFGVKPVQIPDYLALIGDASDHIPGIEGIGPKTAVQLLQEFHSLENIFIHSEKISGKKGEMIRKGKDIASLSLKLTTLFPVTIPNTLDFYRQIQGSQEQIRDFYQQNRFTSLLKQISSHASSTQNRKIIQSKADFLNLKDSIIAIDKLAICTASSFVSPMESNLLGIGISTKTDAWIIPFIDLFYEDLRQLLTSVHFYGHNLKQDCHILLNEDLPLIQICFDTELASYLLTPDKSKHDLNTLSIELLSKQFPSLPNSNNLNLEILAEHCFARLDAIVQLEELFTTKLLEKNLEPLLLEVELPLVPILVQMERSGIFVDETVLANLNLELSSKLKTLSEEIYTLAGETFNINSPKQLSVILFEKLKLPPPKKTQTGFSTNAEVLESLYTQNPIIPLVLNFRQFEKLRSTYVESLPKMINPITGRIHPTFQQTVASTGRLSCQNPNLQNIPIRSIEGKKIRSAFQPQKEGWSFLSADYSQIELRLLAHFSEDPALLYAFNSGLDVHTHTASVLFGVDLSDVTKEMRHQAKTVNFGIIYGQQAFGLSKELGITVASATAFIATYFERYPKISSYIESCKETARKSGICYTMQGRQRPIPDIHSKNPHLKNLAERLAVNTPLQGSAADLIKKAMIDLQNSWSFDEKYLILQIHDELVFEAPDEELNVLAKTVKEKMEHAVSLKVPLIVDISIGKNWGDC